MIKRLFFILSVIIFLPTSDPKAETIKVCYDQWPPMTMYPSDTDPRRGFIIDMMEDIYKKAGFTLDFYQVPYARGIEMVANGQCDMLPETALSTDTPKGYVYGDVATFHYPMAFVLRKDTNWFYNGVSSIGPLRVATGLGWDYSSMSPAYQAYLDDPKNKSNVEVIAGDHDVVDRILHMIANERLDLYADNLLVLQHVLHGKRIANKLKVILAGQDLKLVEKPIFSLSLPEDKRNHLIDNWNKGRTALTEADKLRHSRKYGVDLSTLKN